MRTVSAPLALVLATVAPLMAIVPCRAFAADAPAAPTTSPAALTTSLSAPTPTTSPAAPTTSPVTPTTSLGAPTASPATPTADASTPIAAAKTLFRAMVAGDVVALRGAFYAADEPHRHLTDAMADFILAGKRLGDAARAKYGAKADPIARGMLDPKDLSKLDAATVKETGDAATVDVPGQTRPMSFRRQDGQWKLVVTDFGGAAAENVAKQTRLIRLMADAIDESTDAVAAGKYKTVEEALVGIQQRLNAAMVSSYRPATTRATQPASDKATR